MRIKFKPIVIMFFIFYIFAWSLTTCSFVKAEEPELSCEAFVKEEICKMTPEEQEIWFLELLKKILENTIDKKKMGTEV
jgi:hypothetical protein